MGGGTRDEATDARYYGLRVYPLVDVLSRVPLPPLCPLAGVSKKWRCVIVPKINEVSEHVSGGICSVDRTGESEALKFLDSGVPCRLGRWRSEAVYGITGSDGMKFVTDSRWNEFPKPKIAFKAGWAGPGTHMESPAYYQLISSFKDVFERAPKGEKTNEAPDIPVDGEAATAETRDEEEDTVVPNILNLQLFHREDPSKCPAIPVLGESLVWPSFLEDGAICDNATRLSQRGAVTWWHLDDSGEFVQQTALPLKTSNGTFWPPPLATLPENQRKYFTDIDRELYCVDDTAESIPVKLFLYGPKESYDWFMHDGESATSGKVAALDIFNTPDEALPGDPTLLPIIHVALLESGSRPLISPPNIPHIVVTLNDCIMVEQRRLAYLFMEEISYFLQKCAHWSDNPIIYDHVETDLQDESFVAGQLIPLLMSVFSGHSGLNPYEETIRRRVVMALFTLATHEKHYKLSTDSRSSLHTLLHGGNAEMSAILRQAVSYGRRVVSLEDRLKAYWEVQQYWPKPGCVMRVPLLTPPQLLSSEILAKQVTVDWFVPVVYAASSPVFGAEKNSVEEVSEQYFTMAKLCGKRQELLAYLRTRVERDSILDELF
ncbi:hypothetical protein, conserved [Trypanosoma brucei gambiense DAL972]|uniref:Uncharacterized protein n=1 Tax=Trypanosoma brucei gambiense (strain MHOM/CI/86/DAL972) TaxID=679716 RepID=D0AA61_TRYB9|nr:hypothetical protein, conserved [Trypanosoma brucei gambiense DAL972]CBH18562.1 hypothetical protein, conserved [Trypanosoma brucei gambiense DAL972]|eukprot:XP_011780826.1 hypothetical protein, conserved [Trypanosoma brucei gambiense DAL972]